MQELQKKKILIKTLGEIIRNHRTSQNKTMYLISAESSMSKSTWREAELGVKNDITLSTLWKISQGLDVKPCVLLEELEQKLGKNFSLIDEE